MARGLKENIVSSVIDRTRALKENIVSPQNEQYDKSSAELEKAADIFAERIFGERFHSEPPEIQKYMRHIAMGKIAWLAGFVLEYHNPDPNSAPTYVGVIRESHSGALFTQAVVQSLYSPAEDPSLYRIIV